MNAFSLRITLILLSLVLAYLVYIFIYPKLFANKRGRSLWENYEIIEREVNGKKLKLVVADTPEKLQKGLMFVRKKTDEFDGMIFLFETAKTQSFWNMNTFVELDIYWMRDDKVVGKSELPSVERSGIVTVTSPEKVNIVIEVIK